MTGIRYVVCLVLVNAISSKSVNEHKANENENTGHVEWKGLNLKCQIDINDKVVMHGLFCRVKYCRIIKRQFLGKTRFFVQLILEGKPYQKFKVKDNTVGLDIGPSTIACVSDKCASLERFCDEISFKRGGATALSTKQKEIRRLQRKLDRQRRTNNPQNYNTDGTIKRVVGRGHASARFVGESGCTTAFNATTLSTKKGKKTWNDSKRYVLCVGVLNAPINRSVDEHNAQTYLRTKTKLAELQRKLAAHRKTLHGNLANRILKQGKHIKTEKLSYKAFQKMYGKSVQNRAPGMFLEILRRKAENAGGSVTEFQTKTTRLSQYCHVVCLVLIKASISRSLFVRCAHQTFN